jgi:hypothetical protein
MLVVDSAVAYPPSTSQPQVSSFPAALFGTFSVVDFLSIPGTAS